MTQGRQELVLCAKCGKRIGIIENYIDGEIIICRTCAGIKMIKYYTMKDCFDACGDDDIPFIEGGYNGHSKLSKKEIFEHDPFSIPILTPDFALSIEWQIKRAEPKVLSIEEMYDSMPLEAKTSGNSIEIVETIQKIGKNGQLKQWLNHKELREVVQGLIDQTDIHSRIQNPLREAMKKLKPLKVE